MGITYCDVCHTYTTDHWPWNCPSRKSLPSDPAATATTQDSPSHSDRTHSHSDR
jgi:hypothetical protein